MHYYANSYEIIACPSNILLAYVKKSPMILGIWGSPEEVQEKKS